MNPIRMYYGKYTSFLLIDIPKLLHCGSLKNKIQCRLVMLLVFSCNTL